MRHRPNPSSNLPHRERQHDDQLQIQVIQLQKLIRLQNQVIVGLSSLFIIVVISTWVLIEHLPQPQPETDMNLHKPFWDNMNDNKHPILRIEQRQKNKPIMRNCFRYGCPIRPVEISQLNGILPPFIVSPNHILLTHKSNRQKPAPVNQDRLVLIPSFAEEYSPTTNNDSSNARDNFFLGLFDGHDDNGHDIAMFASTEVPSRVADKMKNVTLLTEVVDGDHSNHADVQEKTKQIIIETFVEVDKDVPVPGGGCTGIVILRRGPTLYMANAGDSTSYIVVYHPPSNFDQEKSSRNEKYISSPRSPDVQLHLQGTITIHSENEKHKAHFLKEKSRIEALGGRVHIPPKNPMGSRVIVRSSIHSEDVGLAMSRSIGDAEWTAVGVIPDPDVVVLDLDKFWSENDILNSGAKVFVVVGSDGLFDARRVEFVTNHLAFGLFESRLARGNNQQEEGELSKHLFDVGKKLVNMASPVNEEWYRDDITFVAKVVEL